MQSQEVNKSLASLVAIIKLLYAVTHDSMRMQCRLSLKRDVLGILDSYSKV